MRLLMAQSGALNPQAWAAIIVKMLTRRRFTQLSGVAAAGLAVRGWAQGPAIPEVRLQIAPYVLEASPKHRFSTLAYNGQVPGPLIRMRQGKPALVEITNRSSGAEVVHWHGLHLPSNIDGAMEEGTPAIAAGQTVRYPMTPNPAGFRWFHTHTFAGDDFRKAQYGGQHGFLMVDSGDDPGRYDREVFLGLHDWGGHLTGGDDSSMNPAYDVSTINGKMLGFGEPLRVKQGERVLMHLLNSSPTEPHWIALAGHTFEVIALDGNPVPQPRRVGMLRLAPAERVCAVVTMDAPGMWVLGEVRKHIQANGMGIVVEYAGASGKPQWRQPEELVWDYRQFAAPGEAAVSGPEVVRMELSFDSKFQGHGREERWLINGKSYPETEEPVLRAGTRYRLVMKNLSGDDHPMHLHRHTFEVRRMEGGREMRGLLKDVVYVKAKTTAEVEFVANNPGRTLFHCHQQDHMDRGFMMVFKYA